jgi:hypothetical protein
MSSHFSITTGFQGTLISTFARLNMDYVVEDVNDELLQPWADLLAEANITRPGPINPFLEKELLKDQDLTLNGQRFEDVTGFRYKREKLGAEEIQEIVSSYEAMGWWP